MIDLVKNLATVNRRTKASVIRELLKLTNKPEVISFAGGLPAPQTFPSERMAEMAQRIVKDNARVALQYGPTEGLPELKSQIVKLLREEEGINTSPANILVTTASQQALDIVGRTFIDPSDPILVELPSYIGGLQVFNSYGAKLIGIQADDDGMIIDELEARLKKLRSDEEHYKFVYIVPDFQNPSGVTLTQERRHQLIRLSEQYNVLLVEDSPYRQIRFEGDAPEMLYKMDTTHNVISLFTFSKTLAPGLRLGFILAHEAIIQKMAILKQSLDLCTSPLSQLMAAEFLKSGVFREHVGTVKQLYKSKKDAMLNALERYMPADKGVSWTKPQGGLFLWVRLPGHMNADELFYEAIKQNVAYVIGSAFHCDGGGQNTMRLNFSYPSEEQIDEGIKRLAGVIKHNLRVKSKVKAAKAGLEIGS
ncbi:MAG TPA: aminotransferase [Elusimicrobia bacterium]|nr:aminotransferase [Elusimicrobiota bacterium]HBT60195.1 aminotransferase [Elusimicrobiota bacterium]